jgi:hypothetical protein
LREIADGLSTFIKETEGTLRLLISPILTPEDWKALGGDRQDQINKIIEKKVREALVGDEDEIKDALVNHTRACLAELIRQGRIDMRAAFLSTGDYHNKDYIIRSATDSIAIVGSANATSKAYMHNSETLSCFYSWKGVEGEEAIKKITDFFQSVWDNILPHSRSIQISEAIKKEIVEQYPERMIRHETEAKTERIAISSISGTAVVGDMQIPKDLNYTSGDFSHQGEAIKAWENNNYRGILAMATGSGKTKTSLIAVSRIWQARKIKLLVIVVPTRLLVDQWAAEVEDFNLSPITTQEGRTQDSIRETLGNEPRKRD